jgi:hypothetical protein
MPPFGVWCVHCGQSIVEDAPAIGATEMERLRDHLLGCPAALNACAPALPLFERRDDVMRHVRIEKIDG